MSTKLNLFCGEVVDHFIEAMTEDGLEEALSKWSAGKVPSRTLKESARIFLEDYRKDLGPAYENTNEHEHTDALLKEFT